MRILSASQRPQPLLPSPPTPPATHADACLDQSNRLSRLLLQPQPEHRLQIVGRELLERHHGLRPLDPLELRQLLRDHLGQLVVLPHPHDGDEVPLPRDGINLGDPNHIRQPGSKVPQPLATGLDKDHGGEHRPSLSLFPDLVSCQGMALDTLQARNRYLALYDRYGALLTDHQRQVLDLHLRNDWSLAEIATNQGTSRAAVHDIVRRSTRSLEDYEVRLGLLKEAGRR